MVVSGDEELVVAIVGEGRSRGVEIVGVDHGCHECDRGQECL